MEDVYYQAKVNVSIAETESKKGCLNEKKNYNNRKMKLYKETDDEYQTYFI